jgi:GTP-binding protein
MSGARRSVVAVVGRPNVGKSTLVNRIIGRRDAIVEERPGVTRDRKEVDAEWCGRSFTLVDTGGWLATDDPLDRQVSAQAERAMGEADVVLMVVDTAVGITEEDERVAALLRRSQTPLMLVANKVDNERREPEIWEFARLGLGDPWPISALHGRGSGDVLDEIVRLLPPPVDDDGEDWHLRSDDFDGDIGSDGDGDRAGIDTGDDDPLARPTRPGFDPDSDIPAVAIVGRPNVGKSTLFNRLIGEDRAVVHDMPGTTRDAIDTVVETEEGPIRFVDTAGMRRKSRVEDGAEYYSLVRALQAIDRSHSAVLVIDASEGVTHQDQRLAERVDAAGSPVVIVLNKWETLDAEGRAAAVADVADRLGFLSYAPVLKLSAKTGLGTHKLLPALRQAIDAYHQRVPTGELNQLIKQAQASHPSPGGRVLYATQGASDPPTFTLFATKTMDATYLRYLERRIREHFDFGPTPIKLRVRKRAG